MIDITDLREVLERLNAHHFPKNKWSDLGLMLGLFKPTLDDIRAQCDCNVSTCLQECLSRWLKKQDKAVKRDWQSLADALSKIGERVIAESICSKCLKQHAK